MVSMVLEKSDNMTSMMYRKPIIPSTISFTLLLL
jgi:hypothetical protein